MDRAIRSGSGPPRWPSVRGHARLDVGIPGISCDRRDCETAADLASPFRELATVTLPEYVTETNSARVCTKISPSAAEPQHAEPVQWSSNLWSGRPSAADGPKTSLSGRASTGVVRLAQVSRSREGARITSQPAARAGWVHTALAIY